MAVASDAPKAQTPFIQPEAVGVFSTIESWWGEKLSTALVERIVAAPFSHLEAFYAVPDHLDALSRPHHLPPMPAGTLRPVWGETLESPHLNLRTAAKLLLYVDSVVEDSMRLQPFTFTSKMRGAVQYGLMESVAGHSPQRSSAAWQMAGNLLISEEGAATPIAQTREHEQGYAELLDGQPTLDGRVTELTQLARVPLPGMTDATVDSLIRLRLNAEEFTEWRSSMRQALGAISDVPESQQAAAEVRDILHNELLRSADRLVHSVNASPALAGLRGMGQRLGLAGMGAMASAGVASLINPGDPQWVAGALGAAPSVVESLHHAGQSYVSAAQERRNGKAIWSILGSFERDLP